MPYSALESIRARLKATRRRQNFILIVTQLGRWVLACSVVFIACVFLGVFLDFGSSTWQALFLIWVASAFLISFAVIWHFLSQLQNDRHFTHSIESRLPDIEQRLITSIEFQGESRDGVSQQFVDQLWEDAKNYVDDKSLISVVPSSSAVIASVMAIVALTFTILLLNYSQDFFASAQRLVWSWQKAPELIVTVVAPTMPVAIIVEPGDISMQRGDDVTISASLDNASGRQLALYIQDDNVNWRRLSMLPDAGEAADDAKLFSVNLNQLSQDLVYYVEYQDLDRLDSSPVRSPQFQINLFDLPRVEDLSVTFDFPDYTGIENKTESPGGDIVAPEGTKISLLVALNKTVKEAKLVFGDGVILALAVENDKASGEFTVSKDTTYQIELLDAENFRNKSPLEYYVRSMKDKEPVIVLKAPGKDRDVMPLEEVVIEVDASDDYGLTEFALNYSVIGVDDKKVDFLKRSGKKKIAKLSGKTMIYLEDLNVQPGDVVSYSFTAVDNNGLTGAAKVISDIYFLEVIPTDHEFSRGSGGGGGGGGGNSSALITNQKDVIAATWKLRNRKEKVTAESLAEDGEIIRESQAEVAQRVKMSINRLTERGDFADENYQIAVEALSNAIIEMNAAVTELDVLSFSGALESEQKALQFILKAEAQINKSQVTMNQNQGGGGGGGQQENADLRELFAMEMGELENRYEMPEQASSGEQQQEQNETLDKLKELARRQERLTRAQRELARRQNQMEEEPRRKELERLQRQQEELRRDLAQLAESVQQQSSQQLSQSQPSPSQGGSSQGQQSASQQMQRALDEMQQAANSDSPAQAAAKSQKALDSLRQQAEQMSQNGQQSITQMQEAIKKEMRELVQQQREFKKRIENLSREQSLGDNRFESANSQQTATLLREQEELKDAIVSVGKKLRDIATRANEDEARAMESAHGLSRALRPIQEKMDTSRQILARGMVNLSLKLENNIESELADLQRSVENLGRSQGAVAAGSEDDKLEDQVRSLRQSLQQLQKQLAQQDGQPGSPQAGSQQAGSQQNNSSPGQVPGGGDVRQGERSGAGQSQQANSQTPATRQQMQDTLERSRELAQGLAEMGQGGQNPWAGSARSVRSQLTRQNVDEFMSRPELLQALLQPIIDLENQLRVQSQLNQIDNKLYSSLAEDVPEEYKNLVETYYRVLSETKTTTSSSRQ